MGQGEAQDVLQQYQNRPKDFGAYAQSLGYTPEETDNGTQYAKEGSDGREFLKQNDDTLGAFNQLSDPDYWTRKVADGRLMSYAPGMTLDSGTSSEYQREGMGTVRDALKRYDPGFSESNWFAPNTDKNPLDRPAYLRSEKYDYGKEAPYTDASGIPLPLLLMAGLMTAGAAFGPGLGAAAGAGATSGAGAGGLLAGGEAAFGGGLAAELGVAGAGMSTAEGLAALGITDVAAAGLPAFAEGGAYALGGGVGSTGSEMTMAELNKLINPQFNEIGQSMMTQNLAPQFPGAQTALNGSITGMSGVDAIMNGTAFGAGASGLGTGLANGLTLPKTPPTFNLKNAMDLGKLGMSAMNQGQQQQRPQQAGGGGAAGGSGGLRPRASYLEMSPYRLPGGLSLHSTAAMMPRRRGPYG